MNFMDRPCDNGEGTSLDYPSSKRPLNQPEDLSREPLGNATTSDTSTMPLTYNCPFNLIDLVGQQGPFAVDNPNQNEAAIIQQIFNIARTTNTNLNFNVDLSHSTAPVQFGQTCFISTVKGSDSEDSDMKKGRKRRNGQVVEQRKDSSSDEGSNMKKSRKRRHETFVKRRKADSSSTSDSDDDYEKKSKKKRHGPFVKQRKGNWSSDSDEKTSIATNGRILTQILEQVREVLCRLPPAYPQRFTSHGNIVNLAAVTMDHVYIKFCDDVVLIPGQEPFVIEQINTIRNPSINAVIGKFAKWILLSKGITAHWILVGKFIGSIGELKALFPNIKQIDRVLWDPNSKFTLGYVYSNVLNFIRKCIFDEDRTICGTINSDWVATINDILEHPWN